MLILITASAGDSPASQSSFLLLPQLTTSTTPSTQPPSSSPFPLNIVAYDPRKSYGGLTTKSRKVAWGLAMLISTSSAPILPAQIGTTPSLSAEHSMEAEHAFTIPGTPRVSSPLHRTSVVCTMEENSFFPNSGSQVKSNSQR